jgi:hypothetical protein
MVKAILFLEIQDAILIVILYLYKIGFESTKSFLKISYTASVSSKLPPNSF